VPGQRGFLGTADRENVLRESVQNRQNNYKDFPVNVPQMSADAAAPPGTAPPLTTLLLDFEKAKEAGAQFSHNVESGGPCPEIGVFDVNSSASAGIGLDDSRKPASGVLFSIVCQFIAPSPVGARATPEAFTNFRLKNGWKVKDYDIVDQKKFNGDWQWRQTPQKGTADPSMRMHLWVNPGGNAIAVVRIIIEGPVGTDPYK